MSYADAYLLVVVTILMVLFVCWYVRCLYVMLFRCTHPSEFFSDSYPSSMWFAFMTVLGLINGLAFTIVMATN